MAKLIDADELKAKLNWAFSHDTLSTDGIIDLINATPAIEAIYAKDVEDLYMAAVSYRDTKRPYSDAWICANDQAIGVRSVLDQCRK